MPTNKPTAAAKPAKPAKPAKAPTNAPAEAAAEDMRGTAAAAARAPASAEPAARIAALGDLLKKYKDAYYNGHPLVSDAAFDQLEDELRALDPTHAVLASVGAPVPAKARPRAAGAPVTEWEKAQHKIPMGSLNKAVDEAQFQAWVTRCEEHAARAQLPAVQGDLFVTEKLDGISLEVIYENGVMTEAITRGDGQIGERITANVARMKGVLPRLESLFAIPRLLVRLGRGQK